MLMLAVVISAGAGRLGPGLLATALCAFGGHYFFSGPAPSFAFRNELETLRLMTFLLNGIGISLLAEAMHRAVQRARQQSAMLTATEELARRRLAEIEATYQYAPVGMCVFDADLRWVRINEKLAEMNGIPAQEHIGKTVAELLPGLANSMLPAFHHILKTGEPILNQQVKGVTPARRGVERTWMENWVPLKDQEGRVVAINVVVAEVTEQMETEQTLRASEERFRALVLASANVVWTARGRGASDPAMQQWWKDFTGMEINAENPRSLEWLEAVHPEDRSRVGSIYEAASTHARPVAAEFRIRARDGEYHWFSGRMVPRKTAEGELIEWVGTLRDITARKAAESAVRESEARFRAMFELASVGMVEMDLKSGTLVHFNERFREITGYPAEKLQEMPVRLLTHPEDREKDQRIYQGALERSDLQYRNEKRYLRYNGEAVWVRVNASFLRDASGEFVRSVAVVEDVTERHHAEEALQESERHYRSLFETMHQGVVYQGPEGAILSMNLAAEEILGSSREELMGQSPKTLEHLTLDEHGNSLPAEEHPGMRALRTGEGVQGQLLQFFNERERQYRWLEVTAVPLFRNEDPKPYQVYAIFNDVTERRRTEETIRRNHDRLRLALEAAHAGTFEIFLPQREIEATVGVLRLFGFPEDARPPHSEFLERIHAEDRQRVQEAIDRVSLENLGYTLEYRIVHPTGKTVWAASRAQPVFGPNGKVVGIIGALLDATERMEAARVLAKAKEEAEAGSRAKDAFLAALSHELRTPLSPVLLLASEGSSNCSYQAEARQDFEAIRKNIALEARLIDDLLDLTRITNGKLPLEMHEIDVHTVLLDALTIVRAETQAKELRITVDLAANNAKVHGDPVRLQQVFWNLLRNSVKFTPPRGGVALVTREAHDMLEIEISDTGYGLTPQELATVFNAFAQGEHAGPSGSHQFGGMGLGLSITRMLVELHAGEITACSAGRDRGSCLTVRLPLMKERPAQGSAGHGAMKAIGNPSNDRPAKTFQILLVEDHTPTRETLCRILRRRGHTVFEAASVTEALELAHSRDFDVLVSDIGLPDGDGCELMVSLAAARPDLRGLAISGYGSDEDLARSTAAGFATHLTKPVEVALLERALQSLR
jgi:PAS domain S-box-containing protein